MAIELPTKAGERVVFWTETSDDSEPSRGVLTSDGAKGWTMTFELGENWGVGEDGADEEGIAWQDGGGTFRPADIRIGCGFLGDLTRLFVDCDRTHSSLIEMASKGKSELPMRKPVTFVRVTGSQRFKVTIEAVGDDTNGHPLMQLTQTRPLIAEEWFVVCKRFAVALDWWSKRMGDDA